MGRLRAKDFRFDEPIPYVAIPRGKGSRLAPSSSSPKGSTPSTPPVPLSMPKPSGRGPAPASTVRSPEPPPRRAGRVHHLPDPPLFRRRTPTPRDRGDRQPGLLWTHNRSETVMIYALPELAKHRAVLEPAAP